MTKLDLKIKELIKFQNAYITYLHKRVESLENSMNTFKVIDKKKTRKINSLRVVLKGAETAIKKYKKQINYSN